MEQNPNMIDDRKYPIVMFGNEMFKELELHNHDENQLNFYSKSVEKLFELLHDESVVRLNKIKNTIFREDLPLVDIERNCVHLANYCYFLWSQAKKMREGN